MSDYWVKEAERRGDEISAYNDWIDANIDHIVEQYSLTEPEAPESIYEGYLDDDYEDAYNNWIENLDIDDVPDDFISDMYNNSMED